MRFLGDILTTVASGGFCFGGRNVLRSWMKFNIFFYAFWFLTWKNGFVIYIRFAMKRPKIFSIGQTSLYTFFSLNVQDFEVASVQ